MIGTCKLCLSEDVELQKSHFLPAAIFRLLRDEQNEKNPNPYLVTRKATVQTSRQDTAPLLCRDCELLFSKNGERWVFNFGLKRDKTFPLAELLASRQPVAFDPKSPFSTKVYYAAQIPEIDIKALSYFAASIFWRGSIYPWREDVTIPVPLGRLQEPLRQFLLGLAEFPQDMMISVVVRDRSQIDRITFNPHGEWQGDFFKSRFPMPGLAFSMCGGVFPSPKMRNACFVRGEGNPIIVSSIVDGPVADEFYRISGQRLPATSREKV